MALSPNYGWAEPDNSSLVKNGAQDIRALGDAIDTAVWNIGFGQAGKNKIINGDFGIWQRGTSFASIADNVYFADRFKTVIGGAGTATYSRQTFTAGAAPVAGYEGNFFARASVSSGTGTTVMGIAQPIEDVRTFAGQTATLSFWAKADSARTATVFLVQNFGAGGSGNVNLSTTIAVTTAWTRFTYTATLGSMSGKTIGTNSALQAEVDFLSGQASGSPQLDLWGVQLEYGAKATPFQTASGGSRQGELAMCQRYYQRIAGGNDIVGSGQWVTTTSAYIVVPNKVTMRTAPAISATVTNINVTAINGAATAATAVAATVTGVTNQLITVTTAVAGVAGNGTVSFTNGANGILEMSSEL
jgi:hypothetical protein